MRVHGEVSINVHISLQMMHKFQDQSHEGIFFVINLMCGIPTKRYYPHLDEPSMAAPS